MPGPGDMSNLEPYQALVLTVAQFEFFWKGERTLTRILYFINRYIPPVIFIIHLVYIMSPGLSIDFCTAVARTSASFLVFGVYVVGAILMTRVYFLWTHNRPVQWLICGVFAAGTTVAVVFAAIAIHQLNSKELPNAYHRRPTRNYRIPYDLSSSLLLAVLNESGCVNVEKGIYWPILAPTCIVQTVLFLVTVFRVRTRIASDRNKIVVIRLLRDGGMFYCVVVLASIAFAMSSSLMEDYPKIALPALLSNYLLAIHSICASHLILSIHSLAADIGSDPTFLLSNIEFSRVVWRKGASANELIVGLEIEWDEIQAIPTLRSTRIGMLHRNNSQVDLAARAPAKHRPNSAGTS